MNEAEKERLIKKDIASIENKVRHAFNQGYEMGMKENKEQGGDEELDFVPEHKKIPCTMIIGKPSGDAISRQAVLDATVNKNSIWNMITNSKGENLEEILSQLPSVTPQQKIEDAPCEDCISRQAAIDAFERFIHELGIEDEPYNYGEMALSVKNVPSVTPPHRIGHWIIVDDCEHFIAKCSVCGRIEDSRMVNKYSYCHCGAKMEEVKG